MVGRPRLVWHSRHKSRRDAPKVARHVSGMRHAFRGKCRDEGQKKNPSPATGVPDTRFAWRGGAGTAEVSRATVEEPAIAQGGRWRIVRQTQNHARIADQGCCGPESAATFSRMALQNTEVPTASAIR